MAGPKDASGTLEVALIHGLKDAILEACEREQTVLTKMPPEKLNEVTMSYLDKTVPRPEGLTTEVAVNRRREIDRELKEL